MNTLRTYPFPLPADNPDSYWRVVAALVTVHDGDTYEFLVDLGFKSFACIWIRVRDLYEAELNEVEGKAARQKAFDILVLAKNISIRTYRTITGKEKKSFDRWVGDVYIGDTDIRIMLAHSLPGLREKMTIETQLLFRRSLNK